MTDEQINTIARHFIIAAIWADCPEGTHPRATKGANALARSFVKRFVAAYPIAVRAALAAPNYGAHPDAGSPEAAFGHDLYLTCVGHGTGFWDRPELGSTGQALSNSIHANRRTWYVETEFYRGWLYLHTAG